MADPGKIINEVAKSADAVDAAVKAAGLQDPGKSFWKSKTFWLNTLAIAANYAGYLPVDIAVWAVPTANIFLRFVTKQPIK